MSTKDASFVLVTSPQETSVDEAFLFQDTAKRLGLPLGGFVFNRSSAFLRDWHFPHEGLFVGSVSDKAIKNFQAMAKDEQQLAAHDLEVLRRVRMRAGEEAFVVDLPLFDADLGDLDRLFNVSDLLLAEKRKPLTPANAKYQVQAQ